MAGTSPPVSSDRKAILPELYADGRIANRADRYADLKGGELVDTFKDDGILSDGFAVVDPRFVGYSFPSYTFIETKNEVYRDSAEDGQDVNDRLSQAFGADYTDFDRPNKALMLGIVLGDFDVIHRRVDEDRYANARFVKDAKMNEFAAELDFFQNMETYPIFEIIRWHGKDSPTPLNRKPDQLTPVQLEIIRQLRNDASLSDADIRDRIDEIAEHAPDELLISPSDAQRLQANDIENERQDLEDKDVILGYSVDYAPSHFHLHSALMGITIEPGHDDEAENDGRNGNHEKVRTALVNNLDDQEFGTDLLTNFTMPYITSGVGQNWGDIIIELRVEEVGHINTIARRVRNLPGVRTTRTYLMTKTNFDRTFEVENYRSLLTA